jgi:hypothetical protein
MDQTRETDEVTQFIRDNWEAAKRAKFNPTPLYFPEGDHLAFFFSDDLCYSERVDDLVTVYYSDTTEEIVGCKIKGVSHLMRSFASVFDLKSEKIELRLLILSAVGFGPPKEYLYELGQKAKGINVDPALVLAEADQAEAA